jgi:hypothetical protein
MHQFGFIAVLSKTLFTVMLGIILLSGVWLNVIVTSVSAPT